ncbi:VOC family protein [Haloparvum sp. PAK95]|uniref:VOC family protein n=1 Tax=Haloparvum sp. PAK95 TaxID=3418962 RepID=UPI003D2EDC4E
MGETDGIPPSTAIGRVSLRVADLETVATFYETVVGLRRLRESADRVVLGAGEEPLLVLSAAPDAPARTREEAGLFHTAFLVPSREALGVALERIEATATLTGASDHLVSEALYLRDPEGNGVEVYCDTPRSEWQEGDGEVAIDSRPLDLADLRAHASRADATAAEGVPAATTVGHVHLEVTDLPAAQSLFVDGIGMRVRQTWNESATFVAAGDYHHHVGLNTWNDRTEPQRGRGLDWFEIRLPSAEALAATRERLRSAGYDVDEATDAVTVDGMECRLVAGDGSV